MGWDQWQAKCKNFRDEIFSDVVVCEVYQLSHTFKTWLSKIYT